MFEGINAISVNGWGSLLKALLPWSWGLLVVDLVFFVVLPAGALFGLLYCYRKRAARVLAKDSKGAWRACGAMWHQCFWWSMLIMVVLYFGAKDVLTMDISGAVSFETQYQQTLPGYTTSGKTAENEKAITEKLKNAKSESKARDIHRRPEYKVVRFFFRGFGYIHPFLFTVFDMIFFGWFFWPGFKMRKQGTKI